MECLFVENEKYLFKNDFYKESPIKWSSCLKGNEN